jgi:hypothetical protein
MIRRGSCLPFNLERVDIDTTISVSGNGITDLAFLSSNNIIATDSEGAVWLVHPLSGQTERLLDLESPGIYHWNISPHNQTQVILNKYFIDNDPRIEYYGVLCYDLNEGVLWHQPRLVTPSQLIHCIWGYDGERYLLLDEDSNDAQVLYQLTSPGCLELISVLPSEQANTFGLFPVNGKLIWIDQFRGPNISDRTPGGYSLPHPYNDYWTDGLKGYSFILPDMIIGFYKSFNPNELTNLVLLKPGDIQPFIQPFTEILDIEEYQYNLEEPWFENFNTASNGKAILFTYTHYICRYEDGQVSILHDIEEYTGTYSGVFYIGDEPHNISHEELRIKALYTDSQCQNFLVITSTTILFGSEEINELNINSRIYSSLVFSGDFERAAVGLEDGSIVVLDIIPSEDQPESGEIRLRRNIW